MSPAINTAFVNDVELKSAVRVLLERIGGDLGVNTVDHGLIRSAKRILLVASSTFQVLEQFLPLVDQSAQLTILAPSQNLETIAGLVRPDVKIFTQDVPGKLLSEHWKAKAPEIRARGYDLQVVLLSDAVGYKYENVYELVESLDIHCRKVVFNCNKRVFDLDLAKVASLAPSVELRNLLAKWFITKFYGIGT